MNSSEHFETKDACGAAFAQMIRKVDHYARRQPEAFSSDLRDLHMDFLRIDDPEAYQLSRRQKFRERGLTEDMIDIMMQNSGQVQEEFDIKTVTTLSELFEFLDERFALLEKMKSAPEEDSLAQQMDEGTDFTSLLKELTSASRDDVNQFGVSQEKYGVFKTHVQSLIANGQIDEAVATFFLGRIFLRPVAGGNFYDSLNRSEERNEWKDETVRNLVLQNRSRLCQVLDERAEQKGGVHKHKGQYHFYEGVDSFPHYRLYLNARASANPLALVQRVESLLETCEGESISFKFVELGRTDSIVIYFDEQDAQQAKAIVDQILECEKTEPLLMADEIPMGQKLAPGITLSCEPPINGLAKIAELKGGVRELFSPQDYRRTRSANQLYAEAMAMAYAIARSRKGMTPEAPFDQNLAEEAQGYFRQIMRLAQIRPETMMPMTINGGANPFS